MGLLRGIRWLVLACGVFALAGFAMAFLQAPRAKPAPAAEEEVLDWPESLPPEGETWKVFQRRTSGVDTAGELAERYRLAGTFIAFGMAPEDGRAAHRAIVDDLKKGTQHLLHEGSEVDEFKVHRIYANHVVLRDGAQDHMLKLSYTGMAGSTSPASQERVTLAEPEILEITRFGKRVGEKRWVLQRDSLLSYYEELLDDPERLAGLYLSMKPDYAEGVITGYSLDVEGEQDFFKEMGLLQGDTIRRVNSMRMVSQNRAEYFITEFIKDRLGAVVLDIERGDKEEKLVFLIR